MCYGWCARANTDWKSAFSLQQGQFGPKFQVEEIAPTNHFSCQTTRMNDLSCDITMWARLTTLTDRRTDRHYRQKGLAIPCVALHAVARSKRNCECTIASPSSTLVFRRLYRKASGRFVVSVSRRTSVSSQEKLSTSRSRPFTSRDQDLDGQAGGAVRSVNGL